jgi:hypothetical protein
MLWYKNLFISTILSVLLLLAIMAVVMYYSNKKQIFPAIFQPCPDYYNMDASGNCNINTSIWNIGVTKSSRTDLSCDKVNFSKLTNPGIGPTSAICSKQRWAQDCTVTWDGITNNSAICYS